MPEPIAQRILTKIDEVGSLYYRLVLVVLPSGSGKTATLRSVAQRLSARYINVNLGLSRRLLGLTERQRALQAGRLLDEIIGNGGDAIVLLDNVELLFDPKLQQDPLRLFRALSRRRTVAVAWNGQVQGGYLTYAEPDHPEYRRYPAGDLIVVVQSELA